MRRRSVRNRSVSILTTLIWALVILGGPSGASAQSASTSKPGILSKSGSPALDQSRHTDRLDAYRANHSSEIDLYDLDLFIDRSQIRGATDASTSRIDGHLSKGGANLFEDMAMVPDQSLENSRGYGAPDLVTLPGNVVGMVYTDQGIDGPDFFGPPEVGPRILFRTSNDGGATWTDPVVVADEADFILDHLFVSVALTASGRLVIIDETPFQDNHAYYSDDLGATWTEVAGYDETNFLDRPFGPVNGKLWLQAGPQPGEQSNVQYIASDDGVTWSAPQVMLGSVPAGAYATEISDIVQTGESSYLATIGVFIDNPCCTQGFGVSKSSDNGATWSPIEMLDTGIPDSRSARIDDDDEGALYLTFVGPDFETLFPNDEIFTSMSTDGGTTFSAPVPFTRYVGGDFNPAQTMFGSDPLIAYQSDRGTQDFSTRVWYGMGGANPTPDADPAPVIRWSHFPATWLPANRQGPTMPVLAIDESGIAGVELEVIRGEDKTTVPLFDDGAHNDGEAGDGLFGGTVDPVPYGPSLRVLPVGTDDGGNVGFAFPVDFAVASLHDIGNLVTAVTPEGATGYEPLQEFPAFTSGRFPKEDGFSFLSYAGIWVGIDKAPGKRVSHLFYDNFYGPTSASAANGDWQVTEYPTDGPGESEMDVVMHYDDSGAPHPMGLAVKQTTYQWSDANYIIFDYQLTNESTDNLADLYVAMVLDPDMPIGGDAFDDQVGYDAERALLYAFDSGDWCNENDPSRCTDTHMGVALLSDGAEVAGKSVPTPHTAHRWSGLSQGDPERNPDTGLDVAMYDLMTSGIWTGFDLGLESVSDEWRTVLTAQPFNLAAGETRRLVFGLVAGAGKDGIKAGTDDMIERFELAVLAVEQASTLPTEFALKQNYPNPFNPSTTIPFSVMSTTPVTLTVFDVLGRQVDRIVNETLSAGTYTATFESKTLPNGAYYYTLTADGQSITKSMFLLK